MSTIKQLIFASSALFYCTQVNAQEQNIFGRVISQNGEALTGVTISSPNYTTQTDQEGKFTFNQKLPLPVLLHVSAVGYTPIHYQITTENYNTSKGVTITLDSVGVALEEVLITGRRNNSYLINTTELGGKFSGNLKDLPQSVSMVTKELMEDRHAFQITDMVADLAGVAQASSYDDLTIRGFNSGYGSGLRLINGLRSSYGYGESFWHAPLTANLESIEVLKGPGASLFGDIVPGGTVNLVTKKPLERKQTSVNFSVGSFQNLRTSLDLGGPLNESKTVLYRLNFAYKNARTFRDNNKNSNYLIAPSFTFKPTDKTQIDLDLTYDDSKGFLDRGMGIRNKDFYALDRSFNVNQPTDFFNTKFLTISTRFRQNITEDLTLNINYMKSIFHEDLDELRTLNTYADAPTNSIMNMRFFSKNVTDYNDNIVGFLNYNLGKGYFKHRIVAGVDYARYTGDKNNIQLEARSYLDKDGNELPLTVDLNNNDKREVYNKSTFVWRDQAQFPFLNPYTSTGVYLQDQVSIGKNLEVILGLRHEAYESSSADLKNTYKSNQDAWLPRLGLTYRLNNQVNYFASYSKGFVPVGADFIFNHENYGSDKPFNAESSFQIETGLKMGFFNNQLQSELSIFHIGRENMLMNTGRVSDSGFPIYRQAGEVISQGVELDFRGQITKEFQVMANYSFNHTEVKSSSIEEEKGMQLANAPEHMGNVWLKYVISQNSLKGLGFGAGTNFMNSRRMDSSSGVDDQGKLTWDRWPGYQLFNAAIYYHIKEIRLSATMNNIFDKYYYLGGFDYTRGFVGTPRNFNVSLGYTF